MSLFKQISEEKDDGLVNMKQSEILGPFKLKQFSSIPKGNGTEKTIKYGADSIEQEQQNDHESSTLNNKLSEIVTRLRLRAAAQKLIGGTRSRMWKRMRQYQYSLINDLSQDFSNFNIKKGMAYKDINNEQIFQYNSIQNTFFISSCYRLLVTILSYVPVINPENRLKLFWDVIVAIILLVGYFAISLMLSFDFEQIGNTSFYSVHIVLLISLLDNAIICNTGFYKRGVICYNRSYIWKKFQHERLIQDIYSLPPLFLYLYLSYQFTSSREYFGMLLLPILLRWNPVMRLSRRTQQKYILSQSLRNTFSLFSLFLTILLIAHVCACVWIFTGRISQENWDNSWISTKSLLNEPWERQYLTAFYFCTVTMATVGYGDISPSSPIEMGICIFLVLFACGVFGFSVNTIQSILADFSKKENEITSKMRVVKSYLQMKAVNPLLSKDITEYLEYFWRSEQERSQEEEEQMIGQLSEQLRIELLIETNKIVLRDNTIFSSNFSDELLKKLIPLIEEERYHPEEMIFAVENDEANPNLEKSIYFIQEGFAEVYFQTTFFGKTKSEISKNQKSLGILSKGDMFGEIEFFTGEKRRMNVRSCGFSTILKIDRSKFISILQQLKYDYEQFIHIKDRLLFMRDSSKIQHNCQSCLSFAHSLKNCPYLHFRPNIPKILAMNNKSMVQERNSKDDKNFKIRQRNLFKQNYVQQEVVDSINEYYQSNEEHIEDYSSTYLSLSLSKCDICAFIQEVNPNPQSNQVKMNYDDNLPLNNDGSILVTKQNALNGIKPSQILVPSSSMNNQSIQINNNNNNVSPRFMNGYAPLNQNTQHTQQIQHLQQMSQQNIFTPNSQLSSINQNSALRYNSLKPCFTQIDEEDDKVSNKFQPIGFQRTSTQKLSKIEQDSFKRQQIKQNTYFHSINPFEFNNSNAINVLAPLRQNTQQAAEQDSNSDVIRTKSINKYNNNNHELLQQQQVLQQQQTESPHIRQMLFDIFYGEFEQMKHFELYFPLGNYLVIIKQQYMTSEQRKKLQFKLSQQQKDNRFKIQLNNKLNNKVARPSIRALYNNSNNSNINANGFDFQALKRVVDAYERESKAPPSQQKSYFNISVANMASSQSQYKKRALPSINERTNSLFQSNHCLNKNTSLPDIQVDIQVKTSNDNPRSFNHSKTQRTLKSQQSNQIQLQKDKAISKSPLQKKNKSFKDESQSSESQSSICSVYNIYNPEFTLTSKAKQATSHYPDYSKNELSLTPPEQESQVLSLGHSEKPNMNFSTYNIVTDDVDMKYNYN